MNYEDYEMLKKDFWDLDRQLKFDGINIIDELLKNSNYSIDNLPSNENIHFPNEDVFDEQSGSQYFLHRHGSDLEKDSLHIHFFQRWRPVELNLPIGETVTTHLAALDLDIAGNPLGWFTVNQWVVGDYWQPAEETINLFKNWRISRAVEGRGDLVNTKCNDWLAHCMNLYLSNVIFKLLNDRDCALDAMVDRNPNVNVLDNREVEVFGYQSIQSINHFKGI